MWIAQYAKRTGLSVSTVRYYVRIGLVFPEQSAAGATNRYMRFSERDVEQAARIRIGQTLGMSLTEIKSLIDARRSGAKGDEPLLRTLVAQKRRLEQRVQELTALTDFIDAKIRWMRNGKTGAIPELSAK